MLTTAPTYHRSRLVGQEHPEKSRDSRRVGRSNIGRESRASGRSGEAARESRIRTSGGQHATTHSREREEQKARLAEREGRHRRNVASAAREAAATASRSLANLVHDNHDVMNSNF